MIDTFTIGVKPPDSQSQSTTDDLIACLEKAIDEPSSSPDGTIIAKLKERITARLDGAPEALVATFVSSKGKQKKTYIKKSVADALTTHTVTIPANFAGLEAQMVPTRLEEQYFRVVEVVEDEDCVTITARHVWYDNLQNFTLWKPTEDTNYTVAETCRQVISNAVSTANMRVASDCKTQVKHKKTDFENKNLIECFLDPENGICAKYGLSLIRNNWDCYCLKDVGFNRGMVIQNGKNLLGVERTESIENLVTRVAPIGKDKKGNVVWLDYQGKKYIDSQYINDYAYPRTEIYDTGLQIGKEGVTAQNIQAKLLESAQKRFSEDKVDVPSVSMTIEFLSLGDTEEYQQYRDLDKVYLYDILTIKDTIRGYSYTAQVIGVEHDILTGMLNSVTIGKLDNWDGTRKIASWQVPEVDGTNIRLKTIMAGSFEDGAIQSDDLGEAIILYAHFASATVDSLNADAITAVTANINSIIAGKVKANSIDTSDLTAINATLGTAAIADAEIANASIGFAQIKAATTESLIARDAVTDRYYIRKLAVDSAQFTYATVGELIIKATDDHYYRLDVDSNGAISPTDVTSSLSAGEITAGVTSDGHSAIIETDLTVSELSASNLKAINALIDKITASRIDVDELWARQAFVNKLMVQDISSNTYIQSTIGNWTSSSTITQSINSLDSRISSLGYGTVYMQPEEPSHSELVPGDIWIQTQPSGTWSEVYSDYATWETIYNDVSTWQTLGGVSIMWVWDGRKWQQQLNNLDSDTFATEIAQNAHDITLLATQVTTIDNTKYTIRSGITIEAAGIDISGSQYVKIASGGYFQVTTGNFGIDTNSSTYVMWSGASTAANSPFWLKKDGTIYATSGTIGGWTLASNKLSSGSSTGYIALDSNASNTYALWCGGETAASAPFRLKRDGSLAVTKLLAIGSDGTTETTVNLRTAGLWKLSGNTITSYTTDSMTLSNGATINFNNATLQGSWSGNTYTARMVKNGSVISSVSTSPVSIASKVSGSSTDKTVSVQHSVYADASTRSSGTTIIDATECYNAGWNAALTACGISGGGTVYTGTVSTAWDAPHQSANQISVLKPYYAHNVSAK